ncbi:hypothetical protein [Microbacterium radiodurans]|uniref:hypothetical protein n=1 Tax=Microbacterium radiodurans TaxID=661398 RepID=UPI00168A6BF7|nr:hypothetical protein [Microbacterium radiodurans]
MSSARPLKPGSPEGFADDTPAPQKNTSLSDQNASSILSGSVTPSEFHSLAIRIDPSHLLDSSIAVLIGEGATTGCERIVEHLGSAHDDACLAALITVT